MEKYRVLITDLTEYGALRCVAGVDLEDNSMVRPEPGPAQFWQATSCAPDGPFVPGNVVEFEATTPKPATDLPHLTEDRVVRGKPCAIESYDPEKFIEHLGKLNTPLEEIFGDQVKFENGKPYIEKGTECPSLFGTAVESTAVQFHESKYKDSPAKPRVLLELPNGTADLSITALDLREVHRAGGVKGLNSRFESAKLIHLRLGLARAWDDYPDRCYMQVNGIYILR